MEASEICEEYVLDFALDALNKGSPVGIITLVEVEGSSSWRPGAQMAVSNNG